MLAFLTPFFLVMKANPLNLSILFAVLLFTIVGCIPFGRSKTEEIKSGRLKFIKTLRYGKAGVHGGNGWYVDDREFSVNDRSWSPQGIDVNDEIGDCEASPNETIEALKCYSFKNSKETVYVLRMKDDKPDWTVAYQDEYIKGGGNSLGEWIDGGRSLIFKDFFYTVQTGEKQEIKGLPDYPSNYFRAVSPDLKTILYQGFCFNSHVELTEEVRKTTDQTCRERERFINNKLEVLWIIEAETGKTKLVEVSRDKYDWLIWNREKFSSQREWLDFFQKQVVWGKDKDGKYRLVFPN